MHAVSEHELADLSTGCLVGEHLGDFGQEGRVELVLDFHLVGLHDGEEFKRHAADVHCRELIDHLPQHEMVLVALPEMLEQLPELPFRAAFLVKPE